METCQAKYMPQNPTQIQISQYGSKPFGTVTLLKYSQQNMREKLARYILQ